MELRVAVRVAKAVEAAMLVGQPTVLAAVHLDHAAVTVSGTVLPETIEEKTHFDHKSPPFCIPTARYLLHQTGS